MPKLRLPHGKAEDIIGFIIRAYGVDDIDKYIMSLTRKGVKDELECFGVKVPDFMGLDSIRKVYHITILEYLIKKESRDNEIN